MDVIVEDFLAGVTPFHGTPYSQGYQTMPSTDQGYHTATSMATGVTQQGHKNELYNTDQGQGRDEYPSKPLSPRKQEFNEEYKVHYKWGKDRENEEKKTENILRKSVDNFGADRNDYSGREKGVEILGHPVFKKVTGLLDFLLLAPFKFVVLVGILNEFFFF